MDVEDADAFILILKVVKIIFSISCESFSNSEVSIPFPLSAMVMRRSFSRPSRRKDASAGRDSIEPVFDAVLYKRLENQLYNVAVQAAFIDIGLEGKFAAETDPLNIDVVIHVVDFLGEGDNAGGIMVDAVAQQGGEPGIYLTGCIVFSTSMRELMISSELKRKGLIWAWRAMNSASFFFISMTWFFR